jgi:hypothetical protein
MLNRLGSPAEGFVRAIDPRDCDTTAINRQQALKLVLADVQKRSIRLQAFGSAQCGERVSSAKVNKTLGPSIGVKASYTKHHGLRILTIQTACFSSILRATLDSRIFSEVLHGF